MVWAPAGEVASRQQARRTVPMDEDAPRRDRDEVEGLGLQGPEQFLAHVRAALEDIVRLLASASNPNPEPALTAGEMAARQAAIVEAAHQEAAAVVAAAHADAARILERATSSRAHGEVIDLRDAARGAGSPEPSVVGTSGSDATELPGAMRERLATVDAELRAAISATGDIAQQVSSQIARLTAHAEPPGRA